MSSNVNASRTSTDVSSQDVEKQAESPTTTSAKEVEVGVGVAAEAEAEAEEVFPDWRRLSLIMGSLYLCMFIVALDRTIIGTAIPAITDDFHSIADVGWYASAYLLTHCAFQLIYGRIYTYYSPKWVLLYAIGIFELGSTVCGAAPSSQAFIVGRAIAGIGGAGIFSGSVIIMVSTIPLHRRPLFQGLFGAVFGVASVLGPLLGGAFTTNLTWRWCFYINLPIGAVVVAVLLFILQAPPPRKTSASIREKIMKLDPYGTAVFLPGIVCVLLALQWGGTTYAWSNFRIILCLILGSILLIIFVVIQFKSGDNATVPIRIIKQRSIASGVYFQLLLPGAMFVIIYFLPLYFQAIKGDTAEQSGIHLLPVVLSLVVSAIIAGAITAKTGYYVGQLYACAIIMAIGAGLITTLKVDTPAPRWIGYQILFGFGLGLGMQQAGMAAQVCLEKKDVMTGVSLMFFMQGLGGAIFISIAQSVFTTRLIAHLTSYHIAGLDPQMVMNTGATEMHKLVPADMLDRVLEAYNAALSDTFKVAVACAAASVLGAVTMEWKDVRGLKQGGAKGEKERAAKAAAATAGETAESKTVT